MLELGVDGEVWRGERWGVLKDIFFIFYKTISLYLLVKSFVFGPWRS